MIIDRPATTAPRRRWRSVDAGGRGGLARWVQPALGIVLFLALVELARALNDHLREGIPSMLDALGELGGLATDALFWRAVGDTMTAWAMGMGLVVVTAVPLAIIVGLSRRAYVATSMTAEVLRPIPPVAVIPLAVLLLGSGVSLNGLLAFIGAFWPTYLQTTYGVRAVDPVMMRTARVYGLNARERVFNIVLPSATPFVATGLRLSAAAALILAVTGGIVTGAPGLGARISELQSGGAIAKMYAVVVATGLLGVVINRIFHLIEAPTMRWHPSRRRSAS